MTLIPYLLTRDESESNIPFHRLSLQGQNPEELVTLELRDSHCINLDCPCDVSWLSVSRLETDAGETWGAQARALRLGISMKNGQFQPADAEIPLDRLLRQALGPQLNPDLLGALRDRRQQTREWGKHNGWLYRDWSHLKPGARVGWVEVFPAEETITVEDGETRYALDGQYCCEPGCGCRDIVLVIIRLGVEAEVVGYLSYDYALDSSRVIEWGQTPENKLKQILQIFFQQVPALKAELPRRAEFMSRSFGAFLANQRANAGPLQNAAKVGRNDPCPCGSGKKYKKCCQAKSGQVS